MLTAIDFGCRAIRSAQCDSSNPKQLTLISERSEYAVIPLKEQFRRALADNGIPHAECEDSIIVFGNRAKDVSWLCRKPCAPLFTDGRVPTSDAPARQVLGLLTEAMLPAAESTGTLCCFNAPGGLGDSASMKFLSSLIRMRGYEPVPCSTTGAANLASGVDTDFTGITLCLGSERSEISISRLGVEIACESINIGSGWIDSEAARQLKLCTWDENGERYLDVESVRQWKHDSPLHLRNLSSDRERTLSRLYGVVLDQIARSVRSLINHPRVVAVMPKHRFSVVCSGGPVQVGGFAGALTERFVEQNTSARILSIQIADDPVHTVVRGLLIHGMLESQSAGKHAA